MSQKQVIVLLLAYRILNGPNFSLNPYFLRLQQAKIFECKRMKVRFHSNNDQISFPLQFQMRLHNQFWLLSVLKFLFSVTSTLIKVKLRLIFYSFQFLFHCCTKNKKKFLEVSQLQFFFYPLETTTIEIQCTNRNFTIRFTLHNIFAALLLVMDKNWYFVTKIVLT